MKKLTDESKPRKKPAKDSMEKDTWRKLGADIAAYKVIRQITQDNLENFSNADMVRRIKGLEELLSGFKVRARRLLKEKKHGKA